jgi:hypothetical protein
MPEKMRSSSPLAEKELTLKAIECWLCDQLGLLEGRSV